MSSRIVVTGMGAVTPLGNGVETYWNNLISGKCGIRKITRFDTSNLAIQIAAEVPPYDLEAVMPKKLIRQTDEFTQYAYVAAEEALGDQQPADPERFGLVVGTAMAGIATIATTQDELSRGIHKHVSPRFVPRVLGNIAAAQIAIAHNICGPSITVSTACASGNDAISSAAFLLTGGAADAVLAVGTECILSPLVLGSLSSAGALSKENDDPQHACRPFDANRKGFVIGEGGGALLLETLEHAEARNATIYGELAGWANNTDAYHITSPEPHGARAAASMRTAIRMAGLKPEDVGYINAHGTGTIAGDQAEVLAIKQVFGDASPKVSSTKGATGHMMGAGGITEAIACIKALETGILPPNLNLEDPAFDLDFVTDNSTPVPIQAAISNAFGFGGQNSSLAFKRI